MPKGYWVAHVDIDDPAAYEAYRRANAAAFDKYGARFLIRGGSQQLVEGQAKRLCDQHVDLDQRHAAGEFGPEACGPVPSCRAFDRAFEAKTGIRRGPWEDVERRGVAVPEIGEFGR